MCEYLSLLLVIRLLIRLSTLTCYKCFFTLTELLEAGKPQGIALSIDMRSLYLYAAKHCQLPQDNASWRSYECWRVLNVVNVILFTELDLLQPFSVGYIKQILWLIPYIPDDSIS
jgi:hypothetical protein